MATPYVEVVFECDLPRCEQALGTLRAKLGEAAERVVFSEKLGIQGESRVHRVLEKLHLAGNETHVLVPGETWPALEVARDTFAKADTPIVAAHDVVETGFSFRFTTSSREHGERIRRIVQTDATGVRLENFESAVSDQPHEKDLTGRYTASHDYVYTGSGRFVGPVESLVAIHRMAEDEPLLELSEIGIVLGRDRLRGAE
ncbi:MAG: hypothetical protein IT350_10535 [Deltaproteobacteria bacterium]|nr:hypothetical protein [Deltaproteobacteria bacterium]